MQESKRPFAQARGVTRWREWKLFQRDMGVLQSWSEAADLAARGPKCGTPGSSFYTNLGYFLHHRSVPLGADEAQRALYESLVVRLGKPPAPQPAAAPASRAM
jgi:hypothetical protein